MIDLDNRIDGRMAFEELLEILLMFLACLYNKENTEDITHLGKVHQRREPKSEPVGERAHPIKDRRYRYACLFRKLGKLNPRIIPKVGNYLQILVHSNPAG